MENAHKYDLRESKKVLSGSGIDALVNLFERKPNRFGIFPNARYLVDIDSGKLNLSMGVFSGEESAKNFYTECLNHLSNGGRIVSDSYMPGIYSSNMELLKKANSVRKNYSR